ncbi:MAG: ABC transporter substrate-binding protein [Rhodospirillaceae bacterium]
MRRVLVLTLFVALIGTIVGHYAALLFVTKPTFSGSIKIAFASSMTGPGQVGALEMLRAAEAYATDANSTGGVNGLRVDIVPFDDGNDPERGRAVAELIAADTSILAVIGHNYSSVSLAAAPVYARVGVPAVTPASTHPDVTRNNPWYFRSIFSDTSQGEFLARYAFEALGAKPVVVVASSDPYARQIGTSFAAAAGPVGLEIRGQYSVDPKDAGFEAAVDKFITGLRALPKETIVLMAAHIDPAVVMVRRMRDAGLNNRVLGPDALGSTRFAYAFAAFPKEQAQPGFYTDGLFVSVPFLTDTGNKEARRLIERLEAKGGVLSTWGAPFAYDAAKLIVTAARRTGLKPDQPIDAKARAAVRDQLDAMHSLASALVGTTGTLQFGTDNTPSKPLVIGQFSGRLISSLVQLTFSGDGDDKGVRGKLRKTPVVYTGIAPSRIDAIDLATNSAKITFDLWFRFQGTPPVGDIIFTNAVDPIILGEPIESVSANGIEYRLYRISARFKINFDERRAKSGGLISGVQFTHRTLSRDQLIYVVDPAGVTAEMTALSKSIMKGTEWRIIAGNATADIVDRPTKGNPLQSVFGQESRPFSNFVYWLELGPRDPSLRRQFGGEFALWSFVAASLALIVGLIIDAGGTKRPWRRPKLMAIAFAAVLFLFTSEAAVFDMIVSAGLEWAELSVIGFFDALWWLVPAVVINQVINRFAWEPMEKLNKRVIPRVIKTFIAGPIYFVALFGIFANVFQRDVTSLIATSGVLAMIIGLALQSNLSNIISGVIINLARPFRPGDWVRVGDAPMGKVIDISWRAVKVQTFSNSVISIPNSLAATSRIENCSYPNARYFIFQTLYFDTGIDPIRLTALLYDALRLAESVDGRRRLDLMWVKFNGVTDQGLKFLIAFDVYDRSLMNSQEHVVFTSVARVLKHAGISLGSQSDANIVSVFKRAGRGLHADAADKTEALPGEALLAAVDGFADLDSSVHQRLSASLLRRQFGANDILVRRDAPTAGASLFLIADGVVSAYTVTADGEHEVGRFGPGDAVGEAALFAEAQPNTLMASSAVTVFELSAAIVAEVTGENPALLERLRLVHVERQALYQALDASRQPVQVADHDDDPRKWLSWLRNLFRRGQTA